MTISTALGRIAKKCVKSRRLGDRQVKNSAIYIGVPSRNIIKDYRNGGVYHAYNRGVNGREIFVDDHDRRVFLAILAERLPASDVGLITYCLMPNHFHLVLRQYGDGGITRLLHAAFTAYVRYFNARHDRYGALFQSTFKASGPHGSIAARKVIAYVHLNPTDLRGEIWERYEFSGHQVFLEPTAPDWIDSQAAGSIFENRAAYLSFMEISERGRGKLAREISALWTPR